MRMQTLWALTEAEFLMQFRRRGLWFAMLIAYALPPLLVAGSPDGPLTPLMFETPQPFTRMATWALLGNLLAPVVAGFLASGRIRRDSTFNVAEVLGTTIMARAARYGAMAAGISAANALPGVLCLMSTGALLAVIGANAVFLLATIVAALTIAVPGLVFVTCLSLALSELMPVPVYWGVLVASWVWGNMIDPRVVFTPSLSPISPMGNYVAKVMYGIPATMFGDVDTQTRLPLDLRGGLLGVLAMMIVAAMTVGLGRPLLRPRHKAG